MEEKVKPFEAITTVRELISLILEHLCYLSCLLIGNEKQPACTSGGVRETQFIPEGDLGLVRVASWGNHKQFFALPAVLSSVSIRIFRELCQLQSN